MSISNAVRIGASLPAPRLRFSASLTSGAEQPHRFPRALFPVLVVLLAACGLDDRAETRGAGCAGLARACIGIAGTTSAT
jgi:hypothetical protein